MAETNENRRSLTDKARDRATIRDVVPGLVALVVVQASLEMLDPDAGASAWNFFWSLLPLVPALWLVWAQLRSLGRADEYQRVMQLEAMAIGFGASVVLAMTGGLLDAADIGSPTQSLQVTFIGGVLAWVAALGVKTVRAR